MVTVSQIRAARGLLGWSQTDLANRTNLSQRTITNIETENNTPNSETLAVIETVLNQAGVDLSGNGVRPRRQTVDIIKQNDASSLLLVDIYIDVSQNGVREILMSGINQELLRGLAREKVIDHNKKLRLFGARERFLVPETLDPKFMTTDPQFYRGLPWAHFSDRVQTFVYGDKFAILMLGKNELHIIKNAAVADAQRKQYEYLWKIAQPFKMQKHLAEKTVTPRKIRANI
jgi:transcriptional regulator with XRE-family HTH domain